MAEAGSDTVQAGDALLEERNGAVHQFVLNRPRALNALNDAMKAAFAESVRRLSRDVDLYAVVYRSSSPRAFCAGGDIRELTSLAKQDLPSARLSIANEYKLDWLLDCFSNPSLAVLEGAVMGSGAGLAQLCTHRAATHSYRFAMPETAVGFFPDVGMGHILAGMPDQIGMYLALTGRSITRADAYRLGLVTHCIEDTDILDVLSALADAQTIDPLLDDRHQDPGVGELVERADVIAQIFSAPTVEDTVARLEAACANRPEDEWLESVRSDLASRSPLALKATHRHIRACRNLDLRGNLIQDYRLGCRFLEVDDFFEGVRAVLIDKDGAPNWSPAGLTDVTEESIERMFASLGDDELDLATRAQMQAARV